MKLDPLKSGESTGMTVKGGNTITIEDVLVGEVWLCSGQSNMAWTWAGCVPSRTSRPPRTIRSSACSWRARRRRGRRQPEAAGRVETLHPEKPGQLQRHRVFLRPTPPRRAEAARGLLVSAVGGTPIQNWISPESQRTHPEMAKPSTALGQRDEDVDARAREGNPRPPARSLQKQADEARLRARRSRRNPRPIPTPAPARPATSSMARSPRSPAMPSRRDLVSGRVERPSPSMAASSTRSSCPSS